MKSFCNTCFLLFVSVMAGAAHAFMAAGFENPWAVLGVQQQKLDPAGDEKTLGRAGIFREQPLQQGENNMQRLAQMEGRNGVQAAIGNSANKMERFCPDCPEMVSIPGHNFAMGKFAVTFNEWDACVTEGGCGGYHPPDNGWGRGDRPVINVSWNDAQAYIQWLSKKTGKSYRLPSEEEWKIAALAGAATQYYWGNDVGRENANCDGCGTEWDNRKTAPVGSFDPNPFGLYDMMGNVWEWTSACWKGNCAKRTLCGGSWNHRPRDMRVDACSYFAVQKRMRYLGFRLAKTVP